MSNLIAWIIRAIPFGTIIMYGAMGEIVTEKSGNLNLGVPGIMYLGGFAGFASAFYYENNAASPNAFVCVLLSFVCCIVASVLGGLIYSFLTISLRANQNVTGLALTTFGMGVANFFGVFILNGASYSAAPIANKAFSAKLPVLSGLGALGQTVFSYGFLAYLAIIIALIAAAVFVFSQRQLGAASTYSGNTRRNVAAALAMALAIGFYDGFIGPGTGTFLIVGFAALGFDFVMAAGNAKILNLMSNVTSFVLLIWWGQILYVYGVAMALCIFAGAFFGSRLAIRRGTGFVRLVMLTVTIVLIGKLGLSYFGIM